MKNPETFPFKLDDIFFVRQEFARLPEHPDGSQINFTAKLKVIPINDQRKLQVNFLITTDNNSPFKAVLEAVSLFDYVVDEAEVDYDLITNYINRQVLLLLWTQCSSQMKIITSSMGIEPIHLHIPQGIFVDKGQIFPQENSINPTE